MKMWNFFKTKLKKLTGLGEKIRSIFSRKLDLELLNELEQLLYEADLGVTVTASLIEKIKKAMKKDSSFNAESAISLLKEELITYFPALHEGLKDKPHIVLLVGVNGSGKTTTLIKLANYYKKQKFKILAIAADTFRAAALEQLEILCKKIDVELIKSQKGGDPSSVVFDGLQAAKSRGSDLVLIDVAGRLHTKTDLMQELKKIYSVCAKQIPLAPHETILVVDATTGQNAIDQARVFHEFAPLTGIILTKLDGTAKGGIAVALAEELKLPILFIGVGEKIEDFAPFDASNFVDALLSS